MTGRLRGKVAVITGGADGMGRASARRFVEEGAKVVVADINADRAKAVAEDIGDAARALRCDVREEADMQAAVDTAVSEFGGLDIFFHLAAAPGVGGLIHEISVEDWDATDALIVRASMLAVKVSIPALRARGGGTILLTSSVGAYNIPMGTEWRPGYTVGKTAVSALARVAALQYCDDFIRVNTIVPGGFPTSFHSAHLGGAVDNVDDMREQLDELFSHYQPIPRAGSADDIANAALYLASDEGSFITGIDHFVDGGLRLFRRPRPDDQMKDLFGKK